MSKNNGLSHFFSLSKRTREDCLKYDPLVVLEGIYPRMIDIRKSSSSNIWLRNSEAGNGNGK